ncbi:MAG: diguanylate cyclase (GGDEF)-like protein [Sulfurimonas sp.]|jgi:diguanylate cyclase (GGDEF)-like protein|uniref:putative bifunctional diguanylate cyclase/phosphodiesterase n=1 Tax=Sulfurimonas sp. TaxID=2022749 RepID=UPI0039E5D839
MNENISFYKFIHKQILVINALNLSTAPGYLLIGFLYTSMLYESLWMLCVLIISYYGHMLYQKFDVNMTIEEKDIWVNKVRRFMFVYSSLWTVMFVYYVSHDNIEMHYVTIATQLGATVVAATILASQKKLFIYTVVSLMLPITIYFLVIGDTYSYLLAFFSVVLCGVLLYAAKNTNDYIVKSSYQAYHDHLTSLGNRRYFLEILESSVKQNSDKYTYLILLDLDYFKTINDTLGHDIGDELLQEVGKRLQVVSNKYNNTVARLGGDEFCVLSSAFLNEEESRKSAQIFAEELLGKVKSNYIIGNNHLYISASVGISFINAKHVEANQFLKEADMAMYEAKNNGRDGIIIFNEELSEIVYKKLNIERLLNFAVENDELSLVYQPQVDRDKKVIGCEVLVRWNSKELGVIGPDIFIEIAERTGIIIEIGEYVLEESLKTIEDWCNRGIKLQKMSINISMRQLLHQDFINVVDRLFNKYIDEKSNIKVVFEITETSTTDDVNSLIEIMNELKKYNISFSMDDFGTGYSSLSYLRDLPLAELKIDQSFIAQISDAKQAAVVKTIIDISKNLDLTIVAEGVEEDYQEQFLNNLDCDVFQGYFYSKPITKMEFENFCTS